MDTVGIDSCVVTDIAVSNGGNRESMPEQSITVALNDIWRRYAASLNAGDISSWMELWTDDGVQMPPDEPVVDGKYLTILKKQPDGSWKIHRGAFNSNVSAGQ